MTRDELIAALQAMPENLEVAYRANDGAPFDAVEIERVVVVDTRVHRNDGRMPWMPDHIRAIVIA